MSDAAKRDKRGRFGAGNRAQSGGGRPKGRLGHLTLIERMLLANEEGIGQSLNHWFNQGNSAAINAVTRFVLPAHRTRPLAFPLRKIDSMADLPAAIGEIFEKVNAGEINISEALMALQAYDSAAKAFSLQDFEKRLQALEAKDAVEDEGGGGHGDDSV